MKRMTLNQTWKECLRMWKWIAGQRNKGSTLDVEGLKEQWLVDHGYDPGVIYFQCFFCGYAGIRQHGDFCCVNRCPGRLVSERFDCVADAYHYKYESIKFYQKLLELDAKRKLNKTT